MINGDQKKWEKGLNKFRTVVFEVSAFGGSEHLIGTKHPSVLLKCVTVFYSFFCKFENCIIARVQLD